MDNNGFPHFSQLGSSTIPVAPTVSSNFSRHVDSAATQHEVPELEAAIGITHSGESQPEQVVEPLQPEQVQQATFSGRVTSIHESWNSFLAALCASQAAVPRAPTRSADATRTTITRSVVIRSTEPHSLATDDPVSPSFTATPFLTGTSASQPIAQSSAIFGTDTTEPPMDPFAALAAYQPISFEEDDRPQLYCGFGNFDDFLNAYLPEGPEAESFASLLTELTTLAPVLDSPVISSQGAERPSQGQPWHSTETAVETALEKTIEQISHVSGSFLEDLLEDLLVDPQETQQVSRQDNPPANPPASYQGDASAPAPNVMADSGISLSPLQPLATGAFYPSPLLRPLSPSPPNRPVVPPTVRRIVKVKTSRRKERPADKYLVCTNSKDRPYMCGYPGCGKRFKLRGDVKAHLFLHTGISEFKCTYPECGPQKYFRRMSDLRTHIQKEHL